MQDLRDSTGVAADRSAGRPTVALFLLCALILSVVAGASLLAYSSGAKALRRRGTEQFEFVVSAVQSGVERALSRSIEDMQLLARQPVMLRVLDADMDGEIADLLSVVNERSEAFEEIVCIDPNGYVVASTMPFLPGMVEALLAEKGSPEEAVLHLTGGDLELVVPVVWEFDEPEHLGYLYGRLDPANLIDSSLAGWSALVGGQDRILAQRGLREIDSAATEAPNWTVATAPLRLQEGVRGPELSIAVGEETVNLFGQMTVLRTMFTLATLGCCSVVLVLLLAFARHQRLLRQALAEQTDHANAANRAKSMFLANMSHEIRTPLNGVIGITSLVLETELDVEQREYLEIIRTSGEHLLYVVNDVLDFSKIEADRVELEVIDYSPLEVVEEALELIADRARHKGLELGVLVTDAVPRRVAGDPGRLTQVLLNLLSNAVKFSDEGGVFVSIETVPGQDDRLHFDVRDTGIGIPADKLDKVFASFEQVDGSTTRVYGGTGLGLAISKGLVELMGGEISVKSELGVSTTFSFDVRHAPPESDQATDLPESRFQDRRALCIDDDETSRMILQRLLERWGLSTSVARDGPSGLKALHRASQSGQPFEIVLLDGQMPAMDGIGVLREMHAHARLAGVPVILLSSVDLPDFAAEARAQGARAVLRKPVRSALLREQIGAILSAKPALEGPPSLARSADGAPGDAGALRRRCLVVDDNPVNQIVARRMLERLGWKAEVASNGVEALDACARERFDAVFMDCRMPIMDGYEATREIRRREGDGQRTPIVAFTANALDGDREICLEAGMDAFLTKPVRLEELCALLDRLSSQAAA